MSETSINDWIKDNQIRTVRLETISLDGVVSGKYLSAAKFLSGVESGWGFCDIVFGVDLANLPQLGFSFGQWRGEMGDIYLRPDFSSLIVDPAFDGMGAVICDLVTVDGEPLPVCSRSVLRRQLAELAGRGFEVKAAIEIEATIFEQSTQEARAGDFQQLSPLGGGAGALYVLGRTSDFTSYMDAVSARLDAIGIPWEGWCDESAEGQVEFNIPPMEALAATDTYNRIKFVMRQVAHEQGRSVTFMAKWNPDLFGQGAHINLSLLREGENFFHHAAEPSEPSQTMRHFVGGALQTMAAATSFSFPTMNSYRRIAELTGPPTTVSWGIENKSTAIRAICRDEKQSRIEYRIPSADANLYLAFGALLAGGILGLDRGVEPPDPIEYMAWSLPGGVEPIPSSLSKAADALEADVDLTEALGSDLVNYWIGTRRWEWLMFFTHGGDIDAGVSSWELTRYFELV